MEKNNAYQKSIFGKWWAAIRKWFYPAWLLYETSIRFYDYALAIYIFFTKQQDLLGVFSSQLLAVFCGISTFAICSFYLTLPACYVLYVFFKDNTPTAPKLIRRIKPYF